jgi:gas vesicle protein
MPRTRPDDPDDDRLVIVEREESSSPLGAFVLGAVLGAGLALLLAPQSGADTRRTLRTQARKAAGATRKAAGTVADKVGSAYAQARAELEMRLDVARTTIDGKREEVERAMAAGREAARQAREDVQRRIAEQRAGAGERARGNGHAHDEFAEGFEDLDAPRDGVPGRGDA